MPILYIQSSYRGHDINIIRPICSPTAGCIHTLFCHLLNVTAHQLAVQISFRAECAWFILSNHQSSHLVWGLKPVPGFSTLRLLPLLLLRLGWGKCHMTLWVFAPRLCTKSHTIYLSISSLPSDFRLLFKKMFSFHSDILRRCWKV